MAPSGRFFATMLLFGFASLIVAIFSENTWFGGATIAFGISGAIDLIWGKE